MSSRTWISLLGFVLLSSPAAVRAAPATVTAFEAEVHAKPDPSSPVIHTFSENTRVSVSEDVVNGFRRVRLPDGKVGYIAEGAVALATRPPATVRPPAATPPPPPYAPPPPPYAAPPPPPRPPAYYYPVRRYYDPTAFRHVGFFMRFDLGLGYLGTSSSSASASTANLGFDSAHGVGGELGLAVGGAVAENVLLGGHFWGASAFSPAIASGGTSIGSSGDFSVTLFGIGPSLDYYFMPQNVYVTVTPSLTWVRFSDFGSFDTSAGFGTRFALGKEWWVTGHWGLGLAGWFAFSFNKEESGGPTWRTYTGGLGFSMTLN
jgi:hypothetical protein